MATDRNREVGTIKTRSFGKPGKIVAGMVGPLVLLAVLPASANAYLRPGTVERVSADSNGTAGSHNPYAALEPGNDAEGRLISQMVLNGASSSVATAAQDLTRFHALSRLLAKTALSGTSPKNPCSVVLSAGSSIPGRSVDCPATASSASTDDQVNAATDAQGEEAPISLRARATVETPTGLIATAALPGAPNDAYVAVHSNGAVSSLTADGDVIWNHPSLSFTDETGQRPTFPPLPPRVLMGISPVDPFAVAGEHPFAVGDLTGDGETDVAVAHFFFGRIGISGDAGSMVSVLDGVTGGFVWSHMYPGFIPNLLIEDGTLVVANETGNYRASGFIGRNGSTSELDAWRFLPSPQGTHVNHAWSLSTGASWARWLALEPAGDESFAAAWSATPVGSADAVHGRVLLVPLNTGTPTWSADTEGYPRLLRYDSGRDEIVAAEQDDPLASDHTGYSLVGRAVADGSVGSTLTQRDAIALSFQVGNINGAPGADWVVGDLALTPNAGACPNVDVCVASGSMIAAGRVTSFDPDTGLPEWTQSRGLGTDPRSFLNTPQPYGLVLDPDAGLVIVASFMPGLRDTELEGLDGATGLQVWSKHAPNLLHPVFLSAYELDGETFVMGASSRINVYGGGGGTVGYWAAGTAAQSVQTTTPYQVVSAFDLETGERHLRTPLLGEVYAAVGSHVNGDGTSDLIVGGESGALFALDGTRLDDESPAVLWRTTVSGPVHQIELADLDGDQQEELVVAATSGVDVLDASTGTLRYEIAYPDDFVWSLTVGELNGDEHPDIVVPTTSLDAYKGADGSSLWTHEPQSPTTPFFSNAVIASGNRVVVQYLQSSPSNELELGYASPGNQTALALDGSNGAVLWSHSQTSPNISPHLWRGVVAGTDVPGVDGTAAAFTWDRFTTGSTPGVDVYHLASGTLAYSGVTDTPRSNFGTLLVAGQGIEAFNFNESLLVDPAGSHRNLQSGLPTDLVRVSFGSLGVRHAMAQWPFFVRILPKNAFGVERSVDVTPWWTERLSVGRLHAQDLDEDGSDEIIATAFDWDGYSTTQLPEGRFSYTVDVIAHGFAVLEAVAANSPTPTPTPTETTTASPSPPESGSPSASPSDSPLPDSTDVSFTDNTAESGQYSDETFFEARLSDSSGGPMYGRELSFELRGSESTRSFTATTNEDGVAAVTPRLEEKPGPYQLTVRYDGDVDHAGDADTMSFVVDKEDSDLALTVEGQGNDKTLSARLSDLDTSSEAVAERTIDFYSDGELIGSGVTNEDGVASVPVPPAHRGNNRTYEAVFEGDNFYLGASDDKPGKGGNGGGGGGRGAEASYAGKVLLM